MGALYLEESYGDGNTQSLSPEPQDKDRITQGKSSLSALRKAQSRSNCKNTSRTTSKSTTNLNKAITIGC